MIRLFVMDVDGTLTDGGIYYDNCGNELKRFHVKDGYGVKKLSRAGVKIMILTGRTSACVERRAKELEIDYVVQGKTDKAKFLKAFLTEEKFGREEIAYIGDDLNDLDCLLLAGWRGCPADAVQEVKEIVEQAGIWGRVCQSPGGEGAVREFADWLLARENEERS